MGIEKCSTVWEVSIPTELISPKLSKYFTKLPFIRPDQNWLILEMDRVWDLFGLDNKKILKSQEMNAFYSHPIWIVNGIFSASDPASIQNREAISKYINDHGFQNVADYGGGFAELSIKIRNSNTAIDIAIIDPYISEIGKYRALKNSIKIQDELDYNNDLVIVQDVLEHVENPTEVAYEIANKTKLNGCVIFANCFSPVIKCHLPCTFHLRHTFPFVMRAMGLKYIGKIEGCGYAQVFKKTSNNLSYNDMKKFEQLSKVIGPILNFIARAKNKARSWTSK